jgi:DNA-binding transcriptional MerR regulator
MNDLTVQQVADQVGIHRNTVLNYEKRGLIHSLRDMNGFRRFSPQEVRRLKQLLSMRTGSADSPSERET